MNRRLFAASLCASLLGACQLNEKTEGPVAACLDVGAVCSANRECCSYGCAQGQCVPNTESGGLCRTSDDCLGAVCLNGHCDPNATAREQGDRCDADYQCATKTCDESANANRGECVPNHAPVAALTSNANADGKLPTHTSIFFDARGSTDPDGDPLSYGWAVTGPTAVTCSNTSTCSIANPAVGVYRAVVSVSDGKAAIQQATVELQVVNLPPEVRTMTASWAPNTATGPSRNVAFTVNAGIVDPDGDPLTCTWTAKAPGSTNALPIDGATSCGAQATLTFTAPSEGAWELAVWPDDGQDNAQAFRAITVTVINDAPVVRTVNGTSANNTIGVDVYGNMGVTTTPAISLVAFADDRNLDAPLTYTWTQTDGAGVTLTEPAAAQTAFVPPAEGLYQFTVTATDPAAFGRPGATSAPAIVRVHVGAPVIPLPGKVNDAELARTGNLIVAVGADPDDTTGTKGYLWVIKAADGSVVRSTQLPTVATSVSTNADATLVAVGANAAFYWVTFGTATTVNTGNEPFELADVVLAGSKRIFLVPKDTSWSSYMYYFDTTSPATAPASTSRRGQAARLSADGSLLFAIDAYYGDLLRYAVSTNGNTPLSTYAYTGSYDTYATCRPASLWVTPTAAEFFTDCGKVYSSSTMAERSDLTTYLGGYVVSADGHASADPLATTLVVSRGGRIDLFNSNFGKNGADTVPIWGWDGKMHWTDADFVFLGSDGTRYAVVSAGGSRSGLVSFAP